eukprot:jgi/Botrbrau1/14238/Bobra.0381s0002.2
MRVPARWVRYTRWRPTSRQEAVHAEASLLSLSGTELEVKDVAIGSGQQDFMHTIATGGLSSPPLVCIPGYGAGAAFYWRNLSGLGSIFRTYAVDLLGTGMSGRPPFPARSREEAEDFFVEALHKWREHMGLRRMVLVGHSLGGYVAATYALRHPDHVQHLLLVCPAGVGTMPDSWKEPEWARNPWTLRGQLYRLTNRMWDAGVTPGSVIRSLGPWGPGVIQRYVRNRFREGTGLSVEEASRFERYFYHIMAAKGSGEFALSHLLAPFAWARHPLEGRLHELRVPVSFIYGETDWMDPKTGQRVCKAIRDSRGPLSESDLQVSIVPDAGHYPFLDQPERFLEELVEQTRVAAQQIGGHADAASKAVLQHRADHMAQDAAAAASGHPDHPQGHRISGPV